MGRPTVATDLPAGLRGGDGVFETLRTYAGEPFLLGRHLARLRRGARAIGLAPVPTAAALAERCAAALASAKRIGRGAEWVLRPMIFASSAGAVVRVTVEPLSLRRGAKHDAGLVAGVSRYRHPGPYVVPPGAHAPVKWLARGPLAHALRDGRARGWDEALLLDDRGRFVEGTRSNLLAVVDGRLVAPGAESHALPGITREVALEDAHRLGLRVVERPIERAAALRASEVLLTSSLLGIASVRRVVGVGALPASGRGPVGDALKAAYRSRTMATRS